MTVSIFRHLTPLLKRADSFLERSRAGDFPEFAQELLLNAALHKNFDYRELLTRTFGIREEQNFKRLEFSDLPLTVARGKHCFVDVYFWRRRPTTIHNHHFTGAFQCLFGKNVETEFSWETERKLSKFHTLGKLTELTTNIIKPGDVQAIALQDKFIHQSHHHADLTVNLCFRTPDVPGKRLSNFLYSGIKIEKDADSLWRVEVLQSILAIDEVDPMKLKLNHEEILNFLLQTLGTTQNSRLIKFQKKLEKRVKDELGIDLAKLILRHEKILDEIQESYN